jgi:hypothetical protein
MFPSTFWVRDITRGQVRHGTEFRDFRPLHADVDSTSMTIEQDSSDFRAGAGVKFAFALIETDLKNGEVVETAVVKSIKINPPPASSIFEGLEAAIKNL